MDNFENLLKESLKRQPAPAGFEARVLALSRRRPAPWRQWLAAAASVAVLATAGWQYEQGRRERERERGEAAIVQLELALKITGAKLRKVEQSVKEHHYRGSEL